MHPTKFVRVFLAALAWLVWAPAALAAWTLDNDQSRLSFISIKATDIGEVHAFTRLDGRIAEDGNVTISINLASVETLIPIRNERMRDMLFDTGAFPTADISARLDETVLRGLVPGRVTALDIAARLTVRDKTVPLNAPVFAVKVDDATVVVASQQPVVVTASGLGLSEGVERLREIAGLPNISQAVPVSFVFTFKHAAP